jgi:hypothetical protein
VRVPVRPRSGAKGACSGCGKKRPGYDTLATRRFEFVPLWGIPVAFVYAMRRVDCPRCGIRVERVPWAEGKNHLTKTYAGSSRLGSMSGAMYRRFRTSWETSSAHWRWRSVGSSTGRRWHRAQIDELYGAVGNASPSSSRSMRRHGAVDREETHAQDPASSAGWARAQPGPRFICST